MKNFSCILHMREKYEDGGLPPAYFSPKYKFFDQFFQTVKNETAVSNLVVKGFLQTSISLLISVFYAREFFITIFRWKFVVSQCRKTQGNIVSERFWYKSFHA